MTKRRLDLSENSFFGALLTVVGGFSSVIGIASFWIKDTAVLLGIVAGAGWALSLGLFILNGRERKRAQHLEGELSAQRRASGKELGLVRADLVWTQRQAEHWASGADSVSQASLTALRMAPDAPTPPPRRAPVTTQAAQEPEPEQPK